MHPFVLLAKEAVETYVTKGKMTHLPEGRSAEMEEKAGVFVCIKKEGQLRGCIGTFRPCHPAIAEEIIHNAIAAATEDPRFHSLEEEELSALTYSVDVLSSPEKISGPRELDVKRYGVIVVSGGRRGLLLPDLEGVESVEEQVRIARDKAGIAPGELVELYRFEVRRYR
ncbi:MAG TPA: AmmeMemoRadiSam system protein A [Thermodesulfovibrionales bacterium]|nr:AmmeMemoRadiSam system protein A [Thermodesulfovibrionales bacterium]